MIYTPEGKIIAVQSSNITYPSIDIVLVKNDNTHELICSVEYNREDECIATYTYKADKEDFDKKTIFMEVK